MCTLHSVAAGPYQPGDYASDFSLKNVDGKMVSLSQFRDARGYIVIFICNTCPVVRQYESRIIDLHKKYVEDAVNSLLRAEPVAITKTRAIGCSVKLKKA